MNARSNDIPIQFLKKKIQEIRSALFFSQDSSIIKIPASIVTILRVDDEGCLWFFVKRPLQYLAANEKGFPARLDFFRKKMEYFLQITGRAVIVNTRDIDMDEWADITAEIKTNILNELTLLKLKMLTAHYFDNSPGQHTYWLNNMVHKLQQWAFSNKFGYKPFSFKPKPIEEQQYAWNRA